MEKADELLDESASSMNSSGVEEFLLSQGISSSPIRGGGERVRERIADEGSLLEDNSLESDKNTTANLDDIDDLVGIDEEDNQGDNDTTQHTPNVSTASLDDDDEIEFNIEKGREVKNETTNAKQTNPPSTVKKSTRPNTPNTPATVQSVNNILKDYGFAPIGDESQINNKVR